MTNIAGNPASPVGPRPSLRRRPTELSDADAVRFLQRATFGPAQSDVDHLRAIGVDAWLGEQFVLPRQGSVHERVERTNRLAPAIWHQVLVGDARLRPRVADALSQIFVVSTLGVAPEAVAWYADRLEDGAFGTYRRLIETITRSFAMGEFLTYLWNAKANPATGSMPDENYAREILQLFSIGLVELNDDGSPRLDVDGETVPTYDQDDVINLARVFTGWIPDLRDGETFSAAYDRELARWPSIHSPDEKRFLGTVIPAGTGMDDSLRLALDAIDAHPNVGPFLGRQLIQRLVTSNPSADYVRRVAAVWADDGAGERGNLQAVVTAILTDDEAWAAPIETSGKLREPVLRFSVITRMLGIRPTGGDWTIWNLSDPATGLGQMPYHSPSVFNFYRPGYVPPQTPLGDRDLVAPEFQIANEASVLGWVNFVAWFIRYPIATVEYSAMSDFTALADDPETLVERLQILMCARPLRPEIRTIVVDTISAIRFAGRPDVTALERVCGAITMIAASPDFLVER